MIGFEILAQNAATPPITDVPQRQTLSRYFGGLAMLISCLGLFGLAAFSTERRSKEIGIRKVLGASAGSVLRLLSKDFVQPILLAIALALPVSWYLMKEWLNGFAYRIELHWWFFALAALVALVAAFATLSMQTLKAAIANPVEALKTE